MYTRRLPKQARLNFGSLGLSLDSDRLLPVILHHFPDIAFPIIGLYPLCFVSDKTAEPMS